MGLENGDAVQAIDTLSNKFIATIPAGQLPQALVYVPDAVSTERGTANLKPLGPAKLARCISELVAGGQFEGACERVDQLARCDRQFADRGNGPRAWKKKYTLAMIGGEHPLDLAEFTAGIGGTAIAQTLGPLKRAVSPTLIAPAMKLQVRSGDEVILQQKDAIKTSGY